MMAQPLTVAVIDMATNIAFTFIRADAALAVAVAVAEDVFMFRASLYSHRNFSDIGVVQAEDTQIHAKQQRWFLELATEGTEFTEVAEKQGFLGDLCELCGKDF